MTKNKKATQTTLQRPDAGVISGRDAVIGALQAAWEGDVGLFLERIAEIRRSGEDLTLIASPAETDRLCFRMRVIGAPLDEIAATLGYATNADVTAAVTRERKRCEALAVSEVEEIVALEIARLDLWLRAIQPSALGGSTESVKTALLISKRRSELLGLDQPVKHAVGYLTPGGRVVSQLVLEKPDGGASSALPEGEEDATDS